MKKRGAIMGKTAIKRIRYFMVGFTNAFIPIHEYDFFEKPGYYMKTVSKKRKSKVSRYEKIDCREESSRNKRVVRR